MLVSLVYIHLDHIQTTNLKNALEAKDQCFMGKDSSKSKIVKYKPRNKLKS